MLPLFCVLQFKTIFFFTFLVFLKFYSYKLSWTHLFGFPSFTYRIIIIIYKHTKYTVVFAVVNVIIFFRQTMSELSDSDLRSELNKYGFNAGPVTGTTRKIYEKKLEAFRKGTNGVSASDKRATKAQPKAVPKSTPLKNNTSSTALPSIATTPLSARKKGRKVQLTDTESDNELELTLASDKGSPTSTRRTNNKRWGFLLALLNLR